MFPCNITLHNLRRKPDGSCDIKITQESVYTCTITYTQSIYQESVNMQFHIHNCIYVYKITKKSRMGVAL